MAFRPARGLFRLWLVLSLFWLAGMTFFAYEGYSNLRARQLGTAKNNSDVIPQYPDCWDYRDDKTGFPIPPWSFDASALRQIYECELHQAKVSIVRNFVFIGLGVPLTFLGLGWLLLWIARGFVSA